MAHECCMHAMFYDVQVHLCLSTKRSYSCYASDICYRHFYILLSGVISELIHFPFVDLLSY